jgi:transposase
MTTKKKAAPKKATKAKKPEWEPRRRPHKPKLTPTVAARIIRVLKAGNFLETAARAAGVHPNTLANWMKWGQDETDPDGKVLRKAREPYKSLVADFEEAIAEGEQKLVTDIQNSGWKGKLEILSRRFPNRWGRATRVQLTGANDGPISTKSEGPPPVIHVTIAGEGDSSPFTFIETPPIEKLGE